MIIDYIVWNGQTVNYKFVSHDKIMLLHSHEYIELYGTLLDFTFNKSPAVVRQTQTHQIVAKLAQEALPL